jgi:hypothetical protein
MRTATRCRGVETFVHRTESSDGSCPTGTARNHFTQVSHGPVTVRADVIQEPRTSAGGTAVGEILILAVSHTTIDNLTGEATAIVDGSPFTCF